MSHNAVSEQGKYTLNILYEIKSPEEQAIIGGIQIKGKLDIARTELTKTISRQLKELDSHCLESISSETLIQEKASSLEPEYINMYLEHYEAD